MSAKNTNSSCELQLGSIKTLVDNYVKTLLAAGKTSSKLEELFENANQDFPEKLTECFDEVTIRPFVNIALESVTRETIQPMALLLENSVFGRDRVWDNRLAVYDKLLQIIDDSISNLYIENKSLLLHPTLRVVLKFEQYLFSHWVCERKDITTSSDLSVHIWRSLTNIINSDICTSECRLLAGTSLGFFLHSLWNPVTRPQIILRAIIEPGTDANLAHLLSQMNISSDNQTLSSLPTSNSALYLLHGILSCGKSDILLSIDLGEDFVIFKLFPIIIDLCKDLRQNFYHAFNILLSWMKFVNRHLKLLLTKPGDPSCDEARFNEDSVMVNSILSVVNVNWTSSVTGLPDILKDIYRLLIEINISEERFRGLKGTMIEKLFNRTMNQPWALKQKYPPLAILIQYVNFEKVIALQPLFIMDLSESLVSNSLAAVGCEVFTVALQQLSSGQNSYCISQSKAVEIWKSVFLKPLFLALSHQNSIIQQNAVRHWLLATIKFFPEGITHLQFFIANTEMNSEHIMVAVVLLRMARNYMGYVLGDEDALLLRRCLNHMDDNLRAEALTVLCCHHKRAEPLSQLEISLLKEHLQFNLNIDSASFRHQLANSFKVLLSRLRDSCLSKFASVRKHQTDNDSNILYQPMQFLYWLLDCLMTNLSPGGCYQRRQSSLLLLKAVFEVFWCSPTSQKKGLVPGKTLDLLKYFETYYGRALFSTRLRCVLLGCILDYMIDIKEMAFTLLTYRPFWCCPLLYDHELSAWILQLCSSPKTSCSESGAFLFQLCFYNAEFIVKLQMIESMTTALKQQLTVAKTDLLQASKVAPMHGLILALSHSLCHSGKFWKKEPLAAKLYTLVCDCACIACDIVFYVISVLAARSHEDVDVSPSFADMGNAIENIITIATSTEKKQTTISLEHQLILACCWLSLKECSLFLGKVIDVFSLQKTDCGEEEGVNFDTVMKISDAFMSILLKCRHRGVIEACNEGFELFCQNLSTMSDPKLCTVFSDLHSKALNSITSMALITSVTRRSAGLPALFQALLKSECATQKMRISNTLQHLLNITQLPLPPCSSDLIDLPQAQALHILHALVHDARFSQQILEFLSDIVMTTFSCFHSASWAIRNAALQAYASPYEGSLIPRLLGQKVSKDAVEHNKIDCNAFFDKWQHLHNFFMAELRNSDSINPRMTVLLILNLLGRVMVLDSGDHKYSEDYLPLVKPFTSCPSWHVRHMAAKAIVGLHKPNVFATLIQEFSTCILQKSGNLNQIHGWLLILKEFFENSSLNNTSNVGHECLKELENNCWWLVATFKRCPVIQSAAFDVLVVIPHSCFHNANVLKLTDLLQSGTSWHKPGYWQMVQAVTNWHLQGLSQSDAIHYISTILGEKEANSEQCKVCLKYLQRLALKSETCLAQNYCFWIKVQDLLVIYLENAHAPDLLKQCLELVANIYELQGASPDLPNLRRMLQVCLKLSNGDYGSSVLAFSIPVWAIIIHKIDVMVSESLLWTKLILQYSLPEFSEVFRMSTAKALIFCGKELLRNVMAYKDGELHPDNYIYVTRILDATACLLQDEHVEVRKLAANFVASLTGHVKMNEIHTNIAIQILGDFIVQHFWKLNELIVFFWEKIDCRSQLETLINEKTLPKNEPRASLFEQDDVNVFAEKPFISRFYVTTLKGLLHKNALGVSLLIGHLDSVLRLAKITITWLKSLQTKGIGHLEVVSDIKVAILLCNLCNELEIMELMEPTTKTAFELRQTIHSVIGFTWSSQETSEVRDII